MTVQNLIGEFMESFEGEFFDIEKILYSEYNALIKKLLLMSPAADAYIEKSPENGVISLDISPAQIRRVFMGEYELLRASKTLLSIMPNAHLYCVCDGGIEVGAPALHRIYYKSLPKEVFESEVEESEIPLESHHLSLVRTWLLHRAYFHLGDFDSADSYGVEFNRLLDEYKAECGVRE